MRPSSALDRSPSSNSAPDADTVAQSFDRAAESYDQQADLQRRTAAGLLSTIQRINPSNTVDSLLEIGCGTGFLTERLLTTYPQADALVTDISPSMVELCRRRVVEFESKVGPDDSVRQSARRDFQIMDARELSVEEQFDLICSNLAFQWFPDLTRIVRSCVDRLTPGGVLVFNTLGRDSFHYWQQLDCLTSGEPTAPSFPESGLLLQQLREELAGGQEAYEITLGVQDFHDQHASFCDFLHHLKTIGAGTPIGRRRSTVARLREVIRRAEEEDSDSVSLNYEVLTFVVKRLA